MILLEETISGQFTLLLLFFFAEVCDHYLIEMADTILNRLLKKQEASFNKEDT